LRDGTFRKTGQDCGGEIEAYPNKAYLLLNSIPLEVGIRFLQRDKAIFGRAGDKKQHSNTAIENHLTTTRGIDQGHTGNHKTVSSAKGSLAGTRSPSTPSN